MKNWLLNSWEFGALSKSGRGGVSPSSYFSLGTRRCVCMYVCDSNR